MRTARGAQLTGGDLIQRELVPVAAARAHLGVCLAGRQVKGAVHLAGPLGVVQIAQAAVVPALGRQRAGTALAGQPSCFLDRQKHLDGLAWVAWPAGFACM